MFLKLSRKKKRLFRIIGVIFLIFLYFKKRGVKTKLSQAQYEKPKSCIGCPGENGTAVLLTVNNKY